MTPSILIEPWLTISSMVIISTSKSHGHCLLHLPPRRPATGLRPNHPLLPSPGRRPSHAMISHLLSTIIFLFSIPTESPSHHRRNAHLLPPMVIFSNHCRSWPLLHPSTVTICSSSPSPCHQPLHCLIHHCFHSLTITVHHRPTSIILFLLPWPPETPLRCCRSKMLPSAPFAANPLSPAIFVISSTCHRPKRLHQAPPSQSRCLVEELLPILTGQGIILPAHVTADPSSSHAFDPPADFFPTLPPDPSSSAAPPLSVTLHHRPLRPESHLSPPLHDQPPSTAPPCSSPSEPPFITAGHPPLLHQFHHFSSMPNAVHHGAQAR